MDHNQKCPMCLVPFGKHTREQMSLCVLELAMDLKQAKTAIAQAHKAGQEAMRFRARQVAGARSLIPIPGTGDANHVGEVMYDSNAALIAKEIDALPVE